MLIKVDQRMGGIYKIKQVGANEKLIDYWSVLSLWKNSKASQVTIL